MDMVEPLALFTTWKNEEETMKDIHENDYKNVINWTIFQLYKTQPDRPPPPPPSDEESYKSNFPPPKKKMKEENFIRIIS